MYSSQTREKVQVTTALTSSNTNDSLNIDRIYTIHTVNQNVNELLNNNNTALISTATKLSLTSKFFNDFFQATRQQKSTVFYLI